MMLEEGSTSQGATHRSYDKYGKRMWVASATKDTSTKDKTLSGRSATDVSCVPGDVKRTDVGI